MATSTRPSDRGLHGVRDRETRAVLSATWVALLLANLFRDAHEILRPGFVDELAHDGTVYGLSDAVT